MDRRVLNSVDRHLPPITTTLNANIARLQEETTASADLGGPGSSLPRTPGRLLSARPQKRPRWEWHSGSTAVVNTQHSSPGPPNRPQSFTPLRTDDTKRTHHFEPPLIRAAQSPQSSPPISASGFTGSLAYSQPSSRTLSSPSSYVSYPSSTSSVPSSLGEVQLSIAQSSQVRDLQQQISTKTLALQTLQLEHDQLLAAFSHLQLQCNTQDKRSPLSDREMTTLAEEKVHLEQQVKALESQVGGIARARDEAQRQLAAESVQWQRIMAMSSQLQMRGAEEARQYGDDKVAWECDRDCLQRRIQELETEKSMVRPNQSSAIVMPISSDEILTSTSLHSLRDEILQLRRSCCEMQSLVQDIQSETEHMGPPLARLTDVNERIIALISKSGSVYASKSKKGGLQGRIPGEEARCS